MSPKGIQPRCSTLQATRLIGLDLPRRAARTGAAPNPKTAAHGRSTRIQRALGPNKPHSRRAKQATYLPEPKFCARGALPRLGRRSTPDLDRGEGGGRGERATRPAAKPLGTYIVQK